MHITDQHNYSLRLPKSCLRNYARNNSMHKIMIRAFDMHPYVIAFVKEVI